MGETAGGGGVVQLARGNGGEADEDLCRHRQRRDYEDGLDQVLVNLVRTEYTEKALATK